MPCAECGALKADHIKPFASDGPLKCPRVEGGVYTTAKLRDGRDTPLPEPKPARVDREYRLVASDVLAYLRDRGVRWTGAAKIAVTFEVPGGGDWSGTQVPIDADHPIRVYIVEEERKS